MKKLIKHTRACWVDFYHEIDCDGDDDCAFEAWFENGGDYKGCVVQDSVDYLDDYAEFVDSLPCNIERG